MVRRERCEVADPRIDSGVAFHSKAGRVSRLGRRLGLGPRGRQFWELGSLRLCPPVAQALLRANGVTLHTRTAASNVRRIADGIA